MGMGESSTSCVQVRKLWGQLARSPSGLRFLFMRSASASRVLTGDAALMQES